MLLPASALADTWALHRPCVLIWQGSVFRSRPLHSWGTWSCQSETAMARHVFELHGLSVNFMLISLLFHHISLLLCKNTVLNYSLTYVDT